MKIPIELNKYVSESFHNSEIENQVTLEDLIPFYAPTYSGKSGLYSLVKLTPDSHNRLHDFCIKSGLGALINKAHCTLMFSPDHALDVKTAVQFGQSKFNATATDVKWWIGHDKVGYLVLALDSEHLHKEHCRLRDAGCKPTYNNYEPHVTLIKGIVFDSVAAQKLYRAKANNYLKHEPLSLEFHEPRIEDIR